ncbi:MAG: PspC domain-containing protein [Candidatus Cloacimonetes bacterium]|nr:PspC domain-containing protein [Candidatus Cloacimonadota bacterium]
MKKLHLSEKERILTGVCGGLSESTGINVNIIRAVFLISLFFGGTGFLVYIILFVIFPRDQGTQEVIEIPATDEENSTRIFRSRRGGMIAGVCSGLATYLHWDVSIIRLLFIILGFSGGIGIILYLIAWFIFPLEE